MDNQDQDVDKVVSPDGVGVTGTQGEARSETSTYREFDTSTLHGLKQSELYQARLYNRFDSVEVVPVGLNRVRITGRKA